MADPLSLDSLNNTIATVADLAESGPKLAAVATSSPPELRITLNVTIPNPNPNLRDDGSPRKDKIFEQAISIKAADPEYAAVLAAAQSAAVRIATLKTDAANAQIAATQTALNGGVTPITPVTLDTSGQQQAEPVTP